MAIVRLTSGLANQYSSGVSEINLDVRNVRGLIAALDERFPGIGAELEREMAIAIDGQIFQEPYLESIDADSEVYFLPRIGGG